MKSILSYVMLGMALLLNSSLPVNSGWADEHDIISFVSRDNANFGLHGNECPRRVITPYHI